MSLLPMNASGFERAMSAATPLALPTPIPDLWNADTCPSSALPWLAWALHVDNWDDTAPETQQRDAIRMSVELHRKKGTLWAVKAALNLLGGQTEVIEWFAQTPQGSPYTFSVEYIPDLAQGGFVLSADWFDRIIHLVDATKSIRSHLAAVRLILDNPPTPVHIGVLTISAHTIDLYPYQQGEFEYPTPLFAALAQVTHTTIDISPLESTP